MAELFEPIGRYKTLSWPQNDDDPVGGGIDVASPISSGALGFVPAQPIPAAGEGDLEWHYPEVHLVENGSGIAVPAPGWYIMNGLFRPTAAGAFTIVSDDPDDEGLVRLTFINDNTGDWDIDEIQLQGTTPVNGLITAQAETHVYAEAVTSAGAIELSLGNRFISNGGTLGKMLAGTSTSDSLHRLAIALVVNSTYEAANRLTDPHVDDPAAVGAFFEAFSAATMLQLPGAIDLEDTENAQLWYKMIAPEGMLHPIGTLRPYLTLRTTVVVGAGS